MPESIAAREASLAAMQQGDALNALTWAVLSMAAAVREQTERFNEVMLNEGVRTVAM